MTFASVILGSVSKLGTLGAAVLFTRVSVVAWLVFPTLSVAVAEPP